MGDKANRTFAPCLTYLVSPERLKPRLAHVTMLFLAMHSCIRCRRKYHISQIFSVSWTPPCLQGVGEALAPTVKSAASAPKFVARIYIYMPIAVVTVGSVDGI